ncbi:MAG: asparagine synthase (glutamine-hydrolyzing) [Rhodomicrobium sp.]
MCGIAGQVSFKGLARTDGVAALVHGVRHRGPDDHGLWTSPGQECVLGHARLSIVDLSPLGHQPMIDPETGNCIVFNGEIYNYRELRRDFEGAGARFRSNTDTEVILALYRRYGTGCLAKLRGMFAFAIWDERQNRLFLARDRVGKKPLVYALTDRGIVFCSEIHPLACHASISREMDAEALDLYLQLQYIPAPWTIYRSIRKLSPAHFATFGPEGLSIESYWNTDYTKKSGLSEEDALDSLEDKLTEAIRLRMIADVPLGALLSGGVDSSVIVALMAKLSGEPVRTFSIGFREEAFNELPYAQRAADICGTAHHPEILSAGVKHLLPLLSMHYGEPYADTSAVPSFLVCQAARRHVTVALNGDGGDELLGGYHRYWLSSLQLRTAALAPGILPAKLLTGLSLWLSAPANIASKAARKLIMYYLWPELAAVPDRNEFWNDFDRAQLLGEAADSGLLAGWRADWYAQACANTNNPVDSMLWYDSHTYLPGCLMTKMDIASMHCGLETRSPLLDHEVIEYCAALPAQFKVRNRTGKYLLKKLAEKYFPADFVHRPKMGFAIPLAAWLRGPLRPVLEGTLRSPDLMAPLSMAAIDRTLDNFLCGNGSHEHRLWALLMFGQWRGFCRSGYGASHLSGSFPLKVPAECNP